MITLGKSLKERQAATTNYPFSARIAHNDYRKLMTPMITKTRIMMIMARMPRVMPMIADRCRDRPGLSGGGDAHPTQSKCNAPGFGLCAMLLHL